MSQTEAWFRAFVLTVAIEVPLVVALTRDSRLSVRRRVCLAVLAQLATHPMVWFVFPEIQVISRQTTFVMSELFAWFAESAIYALTALAPSKLRAVAVSALANGASLAIGFCVL